VRLPFPDARFDAVFSVGVLEHVFQIGGDERASMAEIRRILKPGGRFLCFHFPNRRGWIEPVAKATGQAPTLHLRKYGREDVEALTADGWRLLESGRYNMLPRNQLCRLPRAICDTEAGTRLIDFADRALSPLSAFAQNWYFVARKAED
jgi:SAM-dependent methyltransferase